MFVPFKMKPLTKTQARMLAAIATLTEVTGGSPSFEELRAFLGLSSLGPVSRTIQILENGGHIKPRKGHARELRLVEVEVSKRGREDDEMRIRTVSVGGPSILSDSLLWKRSGLKRSMFESHADFFIQAVLSAIFRGKGMFYGDLLAVCAQTKFRSRDVVAIFDGKKIIVGAGRKIGAKLGLRPDRGPVRWLQPSDVILGIVVGVVRRNVTQKQSAS